MEGTPFSELTALPTPFAILGNYAKGYLTISFSMITAILALYHASARVVREEV